MKICHRRNLCKLIIMCKEKCHKLIVEAIPGSGCFYQELLPIRLLIFCGHFLWRIVAHKVALAMRGASFQSGNQQSNPHPINKYIHICKYDRGPCLLFYTRGVGILNDSQNQQFYQIHMSNYGPISVREASFSIPHIILQHTRCGPSPHKPFIHIICIRVYIYIYIQKINIYIYIYT